MLQKEEGGRCSATAAAAERSGGGRDRGCPLHAHPLLPLVTAGLAEPARLKEEEEDALPPHCASPTGHPHGLHFWLS